MSVPAVTVSVEPHGGSGWEDMLRLRRAVLRAPLGLDFTPEELAGERDQRHLALRVDGILAGTALLVPPEAGCRDGRLRQMAVAPGFAGRGLGRRLLGAAERALLGLGTRSGRLHARRTAEGFYARCGWLSSGDGFEEVGLPHVLMRKRLDGSAEGGPALS